MSAPEDQEPPAAPDADSDSTGNLGQSAATPLAPGPALYMVATPIGNLEDISLRALRVLRLVDLILAEDTRKTSQILARYGFRTALKSYRIHRMEEDNAFALGRLAAGENLAFVTDAGTPGLSDPGASLVRKIALEQPETPIYAVPGPSALTALLSISGWRTNPCIFGGFLSPKAGPRRRFLEGCRNFDGPIALYESVHRVEALLRDAREILPDREILVGRELTKYHEERRSFPADGDPEDWERFLQNLKRKGEFVVALGPPGGGRKARRAASEDESF